MTDNFYYGRIITLTIYFVEGLMAIIGGFLNDYVPHTIVLLYLSFWLSTLLIFKEFSRRKYIRPYSFPYLCNGFAIIGNLIIGYVFEDAYINLIFFAFYMLASIFFLNRKVMFQTVILEVIIFALYYILPFNIAGTDISEVWMVILTLIGCCWICYNLISFFTNQQRKNVDSTRSMDDMIRVIENKCDEARDAINSKVTFMSNISHEVRIPINNIMGLNEMILRDSNEDKIREYADGINVESNELLSLINDILDFSKIENGKLKIMPQKFELSSIIEKIINENAANAEAKGLIFSVSANNDMPEYIYGDDVRIKQIITNLVTNAIKYTDTGSVNINMDYELTSGRNIKLKISVTDTGRGIKNEYIPKLFESYDLIRNSHDKIMEGTGFGLAITKRIIELMNGTIAVESKYGNGSIFSVMVPVVSLLDEKIGDYRERLKRKKAGRSKYHESFTAPKARVLFVDDNAVNLKISKLLLKETRMEIDTAVSGAEALECVKRDAYDIVFIDHMMPVMDGVETLARMKYDGLIKNTPVIALTANAVSGARDMYIDYGFADYLSKPIDSRLLEKMLIKWLPKDKITLNTLE